MTALTVEQALENVYSSLRDDNRDINTHIDALKAALAAQGKKEIEVDPSKLAQNNRQGRKMMQSYFKKRGVRVVFPDKD
jgi:hypothetical protein